MTLTVHLAKDSFLRFVAIVGAPTNLPNTLSISPPKMDRRSQKETFQQAVSSQDPYQLAALFQLPQIDAHQPPRRSVRTDPLESSLVDANGTDWSAVLTNWLDALEAVDAVSKLLITYMLLLSRRILSWAS